MNHLLTEQEILAVANTGAGGMYGLELADVVATTEHHKHIAQNWMSPDNYSKQLEKVRQATEIGTRTQLQLEGWKSPEQVKELLVQERLGCYTCAHIYEAHGRGYLDGVASFSNSLKQAREEERAKGSRMNELELIRKAFAKWGAESQRRMAIEECSELIKALCKYERDPGTRTALDVVEEMVDVELMLGQLKLMFVEWEHHAEHMKREKLTRLSELLV